MTRRSLSQWITAIFIVVSAAALVVGVAIERHSEGHETRAAHSAEQGAEHRDATAPNGEGAAVGDEAAGGADNDQAQALGQAADDDVAKANSEKLFGVNPESTGLLIVAALASLLLAALILSVASPAVIAVIVVAMLAFTALDVREITHQLNESRTGLAAIAATVALLHAVAAGAAACTRRAPRLG